MIYDSNNIFAKILRGEIPCHKVYEDDATIVFMAVPGEEQGLLGATYYAEQAKQKAVNIEAMITNDIVGGVTTQKNSRHRNRLRVFAEGVPSDETDRQANMRRSVGGENDSPARRARANSS